MSNARRSWDNLWLTVAQELATMSTCHRRNVGCVFVDAHNKVLSTGFNGVPPKHKHCRGDGPDIVKCSGAFSPSGINIDGCEANHAEINAMIHCTDNQRVHTIYVTCSPCMSCIKALACTSAVNIVYSDMYPGFNNVKEFWESSRVGKNRRKMVHFGA